MKIKLDIHEIQTEVTDILQNLYLYEYLKLKNIKCIREKDYLTAFMYKLLLTFFQAHIQNNIVNFSDLVICNWKSKHIEFVDEGWRLMIYFNINVGVPWKYSAKGSDFKSKNKNISYRSSSENFKGMHQVSHFLVWQIFVKNIQPIISYPKLIYYRVTK